ncbi:MAG: hypothetical protein GZ085_04570 [Sulfuriferula multivorans]|uniref:Cytochrome c n=1 Tax=Sulfuriferula multivorans TaxID=1559896 RepID=A0A7C9NQM3_9PROT|nr:hypothetical protein [Sulfuriferula multivorans]
MNLSRLAFATLFALSSTLAHAADPHAHHAPSTHLDKRVVLNLTPNERALLLEEMHLFLDGLQKMTGALAKQNMEATAQSARKLGLVMAHEVPPAMRAKLPMEFRQLGSSVHRDFDQIAMDAESLKDVSHTLSQISATLQKCASCHATFQAQKPILPLKR